MYIALNTKVSDIIKVILFFTNFDKKNNLFKKTKDNKSVQLTITKANILK